MQKIHKSQTNNRRPTKTRRLNILKSQMRCKKWLTIIICTKTDNQKSKYLKLKHFSGGSEIYKKTDLKKPYITTFCLPEAILFSPNLLLPFKDHSDKVHTILFSLHKLHPMKKKPGKFRLRQNFLQSEIS